MIKHYEELLVFQKAYAASLEIHKKSLSFPKLEQYELGSQLRRATKSIPMNIAEGWGRRGSTAEFKRFLTIALGSNDEVMVQLKYCEDLGYMTEMEYAAWAADYTEIGKMLSTLLKNWQ